MATNTTNLNLIKPGGSDKIRIAQINQNMDILDEKIGPVGNTSLQAQMSTITGYTTMSNGTNLNALTNKANYLVGNISQMLNAPTGAGTSGFFYVEKNSSYILQRFWGNLDKAYRFSYNNGSTWNSWVVHKTQIDSLNSHIEAHWFGNNTLANIQTAMVSFAQDVPDGGVRSIEFGISTASGKFGATNYIGKLERISGSRLCVTVMNAMYSANMVIGNYKDGTWYWDEVATNSQVKLKRITKTYTNLTLPNTDNPYTQIDDYNGLGVNTGYYLVSMIIRGWSNTHVGNMSLLKSSNGSEFYLMGSTGGSIGTVTVEYFFVPSVDAL